MDGIQVVGPNGYQRIAPNDEEQLMRALRYVGPVSTIFYVKPDFFSYQSGIYTAENDCIDKSVAPHSVLIIGFGIENG
jgi:hypothetical protein